jgi:hypothetical protein
MAQPLADLSQELMLPGLDAVPPNTVLPLATNTRFVQAYMAGLNSEMAREFLWRGYPAPPRATFFRRFWDSRSDAAPPDIDPISDWGERLLGTPASSSGLSAAVDGTGGGERFVMLVRSELLKRYPNAIVYATRRVNGTTLERLPVFSGGFAPDLRFFGFDLTVDEMHDWSLVIQEQPTEPRFGIEADVDTGGASHVGATQGHAALFASAMRQMPVRIVLPSSNLLLPRTA